MLVFSKNSIQTKIIATIGPASETFEVIEALFKAGVRIFRLNFSHNDAQWHNERAQIIREVSKKYEQHLAILVDLQGPKIRLGEFEDGKIYVKENQIFSLKKYCIQGNQQEVSIDCPEIFNDVFVGDLLLFDDGKFLMQVQGVTSDCITGYMKNSGWLLSRKGVNKRGGGLSAKTLTSKDRKDLQTAMHLHADYIGLSFVRSAEDVRLARNLIRQQNSHARIVSKIECAEAVSSVQAMQSIIQVSDAIMVARGDLGVEIGDAVLAMTQKQLIAEAQKLGVPVITATQIMESMVENSIPTRAEVLDLSNAIIDGTAAVMLSAETTIGQYPIETIKKVYEVCHGVESSLRSKENSCVKRFFEKSCAALSFKKSQSSDTEVIVKSAAHAIKECPDISAIFVLTASAQTVLSLSSFAQKVKIFAISESDIALRQSQLCRGVYPLFFPSLPDTLKNIDHNVENFETTVLKFAVDKQLVSVGQQVMFIRGSELFVAGGSNTLRILTIGDATTNDAI